MPQYCIRSKSKVIKQKCSQRKFVQRIKWHSNTLTPKINHTKNSKLRRNEEKKLYRWQFKRNWCLNWTSIELFGPRCRTQTHTRPGREKEKERKGKTFFPQKNKEEIHTNKLCELSKFSVAFFEISNLSMLCVQNFFKEERTDFPAFARRLNVWLKYDIFYALLLLLLQKSNESLRYVLCESYYERFTHFKTKFLWFFTRFSFSLCKSQSTLIVGFSCPQNISFCAQFYSFHCCHFNN